MMSSSKNAESFRVLQELENRLEAKRPMMKNCAVITTIVFIVAVAAFVLILTIDGIFDTLWQDSPRFSLSAVIFALGWLPMIYFRCYPAVVEQNGKNITLVLE